ncbi:hypothetical protein DFH07DRAFT_961550 [Mycena maculata]|uniref:Uncharacterized protein n=1 Tax=Mycena maculata TaxID=230809 RepID=A0AAD7IVL2_9AGAR|nr:hypothetical protein DFH07DRAFT_961550 [Mycena maculata]
MQKRVTAELWANASEEERTAVAAEMAKESHKRRDVDDDSDFNKSKTSSPEELQQGINALNAVYADVHKATYNASGWVGMTILGGPNPRYGGKLALKIICLGKTHAGNTYEDVCVDFDKNVTQTFKAFLRQCFNQCRSCAIPSPLPPSEPLPRIPREPAPPALEGPAKAKKTKQKKKKTPSAPIVQDEDVAAISPGSETPEAGSPESGVTSESVATPEGPQDLFANSLSFDDEDLNDSNFFGSMPSPEPWRPSSLELEPQESSRWPDGMGPPLSPKEAVALARMERGGASGEGATIAIDPQLMALSLPRSRSPPPPPPSSSPTPMLPARPQPRAAYSGAGCGDAANAVTVPVPTVRVGGYNFPVVVALEASTYRPSTLLQAFTPRRRSVPPTTLHTASPTPLTPLNVRVVDGGETWAARQAKVLFTLKASSEPTTEPAVHAPVVLQSRLAIEPAARAPILPQSRPATEGPAPPVAPTAAPALVVPRSRPATKPPTAPPAAKAKTKAGAAAKEVAAKAAKKVEVKRTAVRGTRAVAAESTESAEGALPGPKKRGRPKKGVAEEGETVLADVTNAVPEGPTFSITNNNRQGARRAAVEEKERVAAEAEKQAAQGWVRTMQNGHNCVVLTSGRVRKLTTFHDGSVAQRKVKGRRNPHAALEDVLVAHAMAACAAKGPDVVPTGNKRKAAGEATTSTPKSKKCKA